RGERRNSRRALADEESRAPLLRELISSPPLRPGVGQVLGICAREQMLGPYARRGLRRDRGWLSTPALTGSRCDRNVGHSANSTCRAAPGSVATRNAAIRLSAF